jgi:hypothetical protein
MLRFTDSQLDAIMTASRHVPRWQRDEFLHLIAAALEGRGPDLGDGDESQSRSGRAAADRGGRPRSLRHDSASPQRRAPYCGR